ncbi:MAG: PIG-L family deacetylase [Cytophagales bacterium]|nr:PIG-L family deacetylase [Cytophagales bacterium]
MKRFLILCIPVILSVGIDSNAQKPRRFNSADIQIKLQKLKVLGNVLYVAAHPDDENTRLITYMANEKKVNTAYFSFTRGDGGQNLIGSEIREELGVIRTQELLEARKIDRGQQFFSRAVDFGYSKHPDETFKIWDKEEVLGDLVWVIRKFRPDVIITRFNTVPGTTHGHHTASAILAGEAFDLAGDETKYPEQLLYLKPWQPASLYWNAYFWRKSDYQKDVSELIGYDIGMYNHLLGESYSEIAAQSRSSHRSQGFGATGNRGIQMDYLQFEKGEKAGEDIFEHIDISWNRVDGGKQIEDYIDEILKDFDPVNPEKIVDRLLVLYQKIEGIDDDFWKNKKQEEVNELIYAITGLFLEVKANDFSAHPGQKVNLEIEAINRSNVNITLKKVVFKSVGVGSRFDVELKNNNKQELKAVVTIPQKAAYSQPYWLAADHSKGMFEVDDQRQIGRAQNEAAISAEFVLDIEGQELIFEKPVIYKRNDPVRGEVYQPFVISPPVFINIAGGLVVFANHASQDIDVEIVAGKNTVNGKLALNLPDTWEVSPKAYDFSLSMKGERKNFSFKIKPPDKQETALVRGEVHMDGQIYDRSLTKIEYDHIPTQLLFSKAKVKFVKVDLDRGDENIGYLMGAGDNIPENLRQIGYDVTVINNMEFDPESLDEFDVIILGVRALNTEERLKFDMQKLLDFVERGGTLIVQYNTSHRLVTKEFSPHSITLSRNRVAVEEAEVRILDAGHKVLNYPNKIDESDFQDWIQERGLYFPGSWSDEYDAILSSNDPGEGPLDGGLLITEYGKGYFVYSSYSWFRELPAGIPGAYRLFVNMISLKQEK